jgi:hypothetical protein
LGLRFGPGDTYGVTEAAQAVRRTLNEVQISSRTGRPYLNPDTFWDYTDSLTILAPLARESGSGTAWRASTYTRTVPFQADWPLDDTLSVEVTAATAYVQNGKWADFIGAWYTESMTPSLGEWCLYTPPPQVGDPEPEVIALSVQAEGDNAVRLSWAAADLSDTDTYWVFATRPEQVGFRLVATLSGITIVVGVPPGVIHQLFGQVRSLPVLEPWWRNFQCLQPLFRGWERAGVELVHAQRGLQSGDVRTRCRDPGFVALVQKPRPHQCGKEGDDRHHHQHFDEGDAGLANATSPTHRPGTRRA